MGIISTVELKKYVAGNSILGIIVSKLCYEKSLYPIILLKVDKSLKVGFYCTILPLNLAVYLKVKCDRKFLLQT